MNQVLAGISFTKTDLYLDTGVLVVAGIFAILAAKGRIPTLAQLIESWSAFTETLQQRGGTIGLLFVASFILGFMVMRTKYLGIDAESASTIRTTFSGFTGALLIALTSKDKNGEVPPTPKTNVVEQKSVVTTTSVPPEKTEVKSEPPKETV